MLRYSYIDYVNLMDLAINIKNLRSNTSQEERQKLEEHVNTKLNSLLKEIHNHLKDQDRKIDLILERLGVDKDDN